VKGMTSEITISRKVGECVGSHMLLYLSYRALWLSGFFFFFFALLLCLIDNIGAGSKERAKAGAEGRGVSVLSMKEICCNVSIMARASNIMQL